MSYGSSVTTDGSSVMTNGTSVTTDGASVMTDGVSAASNSASGRAGSRRGSQKKGACTWHAPRGSYYLLSSGAVGAGTGVPASGGVVTGGGTTVGLGRVRNGWMPNSTSLSLPLP
jgi:hypothetical protein